MAFHVFKEPIYKKGVSYFLLQLTHWKDYNIDIYKYITSNPQNFNEVICETSLSFYASQLANSPYNNDFNICKDLWKNTGVKRIHAQKLRTFLNIKGSHTSLDCKVQTTEVQLIKDGLSSILEDLVIDKACIYPYFKNGMYLFYMILNIVLVICRLTLFPIGFIDMWHKIPDSDMRKPSMTETRLYMTDIPTVIKDIYKMLDDLVKVTNQPGFNEVPNTY